MALQGDLDSFPLADVLSLLAATAKSGRLEVQAATGTGELWLRRGNLIGGAASASPHVEQPDEVVYELLRLGGGLFHFDDIEVDDEGPEMSATDAITRAEALVAEWSAIESVVPSVWSSLALRAELSARP